MFIEHLYPVMHMVLVLLPQFPAPSHVLVSKAVPAPLQVAHRSGSPMVVVPVPHVPLPQTFSTLLLPVQTLPQPVPSATFSQPPPLHLPVFPQVLAVQAASLVPSSTEAHLPTLQV